LDVAVARLQQEREERRRNLLLTALHMYDALIRAEERKAEAEKRRRQKRNKRLWVRPWIERRVTRGGGVLLCELADEDPSSYTNALRMNSDMFDELLAMIQPSIQRQNTVMRNALSARLKLEVTLRYLASGDSLKSLALLFRLPTCTISKFLPEVLKVIHTALAHCLRVNN
jgi:hypothetical protein